MRCLAARAAKCFQSKESRIAAAFREMLYLKRRVSNVCGGAPLSASYLTVSQIPLLSH